jgi:hypothetical protein
MKNLVFVSVALLALAGVGCKKKGGGGDCAGAIDHSMELSKADMAKMPGMDDKAMGKMKGIAVQHCQDDKWPEEAVKCMADAKDEKESQGCYNKLSKDQQEKMMNAMMESMKPPGGAPSAPAPARVDTNSAPAPAAGSAPAGSASGSAPAAGDTGSAAAPK